MTMQKRKSDTGRTRLLFVVLMLFTQLAMGAHWSQHFSVHAGNTLSAQANEQAPIENGDEGAECVICHVATSSPTPVQAVIAFLVFAFIITRRVYDVMDVAFATIPLAFCARAPPRSFTK